MTLKKAKQQNNTTRKTEFRTIIKNRHNKQTIGEIASLSASIQQSIQNDEKYSVRSANSVHSIKGIQCATDKIKNYVRNMKQNKSNVLNLSNNVSKHVANEKDETKSVHSVRSMKSNKDSRYNSFFGKDNDAKSVISTQSLSDSRYLSKSKIIFPKQGNDTQRQNRLEKLNKMEQKMDYLIKNKLKNLMIKARSKYRYQSRPFLGSGGSFTTLPQNVGQTPENSMLQKQIQCILTCISNLKMVDTQEKRELPQINEDISQLNKKIQLLEKIIASSFTQSQILKKLYFADKSQKYPHLSRKQKILQQMNKRKEALKANYSLVELRNKTKNPMINLQSTSKYFYSKPDKSAYNIQKHKYNSFVANRQPLPRSTYGRQYLNYGTLPVFNYKPHDNKHSIAKMSTKTSSYQESFKQKNIEMKQINYKELDCFKNKIKSSNVSFAEMYKNSHLKKKKIGSSKAKGKEILVSLTGKENNASGVQKAIQTLTTLQQSKLNDHENQARFMAQTQMKRQYIWHSKGFKSQQKQSQYLQKSPQQLELKSVIKNGNLNKLKASYKSSFLR